MKKSKSKKIPKLKLEYLRQIDKNLMLHATQPHEHKFNRYEAPPIVLKRIVYILETLTKDYKKAFKISLAAEKEAKKAGNVGSLEAMLARWTTTIKGMSK